MTGYGWHEFKKYVGSCPDRGGFGCVGGMALGDGTGLLAAGADSVRLLQEVTVAARRSVRTMATSQTLQGEELQALSNTSVADALKYFAGVQIKDYGGLGGLKTVNVRSLGAQHVGVYVDGIRVTSARSPKREEQNSSLFCYL